MFGKKLKELRKKHNLLQKDIAKLLNVSPSTIGMYERGHRDPDTDTLTQLADYFNVSTDYLLGRTSDPNTRIIDKDELPQELIEVGYDYIEIVKDAKASDLTAEELKDLVEFAKKVKKQR